MLDANPWLIYCPNSQYTLTQSEAELSAHLRTKIAPYTLTFESVLLLELIAHEHVISL